MKESSVSGSDSDCAESYCDACNCDHEMDQDQDHTPQNIDSRIMLLKLKKARLETRVAYSRTRLLLAEMELRMAERQLHLEAKNASPAHTPKRPQRKRPHKLVKLLNRVFKASNQNTEEHTTVTLEVKDAKKKNVEETQKRNKIKKTDDSQDRENRNNFRINTQENIQEITDISKKSSKSKNTSDEKKKTETKIKEKKCTEKNKGDKKHKISKDSKRHKQEKSKEKDNNNGKVGKELKSILKKTSITEETNNNILENISKDGRVINEDSVEYNVRNTFCSSGLFNNSCIYQMDTTNVDKALETIGENDEDIFIKKKVMAPIFKGIVEVVDVMESQNDQLFKELRGNDARHVASSLGSMETLVLDEESEDGKF